MAILRKAKRKLEYILHEAKQNLKLYLHKCTHQLAMYKYTDFLNLFYLARYKTNLLFQAWFKLRISN